MKKVVITQPVVVALRTLDEDNRRKVHAWFDRLAHWDEDEFVRSHSHCLELSPNVYVLKTSTDFRIFFRIDNDTITIIDLARKQSILASGAMPGAE